MLNEKSDRKLLDLLEGPAVPGGAVFGPSSPAQIDKRESS